MNSTQDSYEPPERKSVTELLDDLQDARVIIVGLLLEHCQVQHDRLQSGSEVEGALHALTGYVEQLQEVLVDMHDAPVIHALNRAVERAFKPQTAMELFYHKDGKATSIGTVTEIKVAPPSYRAQYERDPAEDEEND